MIFNSVVLHLISIRPLGIILPLFRADCEADLDRIRKDNSRHWRCLYIQEQHLDNLRTGPVRLIRGGEQVGFL
jgi:hypothetical protein